MMAGITLRDYIREIEKQIDGKRYDEATAHCHYMLQSYPKAVEIYRLLGKAFLENQRYGDAADIFQRVLSALPDDFVSHAGMSIIREDEGNLDEAIWHMERAFDVQPANSALQEELRRMYERRDNVEPLKIRLTRSALARMYFKGQLYPQAIAETRAALAESPDRLDLQSLLTEIYAGAGQKAEAVEAAAKLIRKLPYCIVANRVLYETLRGSERDAEAQTHLERLNQVEPYFAFISDTYPTLESVPDSSIRLDKL
jgi:tetratricopeptide (TPR) repeat protein